MNGTWFAIHDNADKIFSADEVRISFNKDPRVGRVWVMSYAQLADLQNTIANHLDKETG
jgi:hypothetical protein